jgi:uncharacterized protein
MNTAYSKAFAATGHEAYREKAISNMEFLLRAFAPATNLPLMHVWKNNTARIHAFLDDYAFLIEALLQLQEITSNFQYLEQAARLTEYVISVFSEKETGYFFYTPQDQQDIIVRKKEVYDGAVPSGNAVMCSNLYKLGILYNNANWMNRSVQMLGALTQAVVRYPSSFGVWAAHLLNLLQNYNEIAVVGPNYEEARDELLKLYIPGKIVQASARQQQNWPLLAQKEGLPNCSIYYLCTNYSCKQPVQTPAALYLFIKENRLKQ